MCGCFGLVSCCSWLSGAVWIALFPAGGFRVASAVGLGCGVFTQLVVGLGAPSFMGRTLMLIEPWGVGFQGLACCVGPLYLFLGAGGSELLWLGQH